jgi:hypothetical protein
MRKIVTRRVPDIGALGLAVGQLRRAMRLRGRRVYRCGSSLDRVLQARSLACNLHLTRRISWGPFCLIRVGLVYLKSKHASVGTNAPEFVSQSCVLYKLHRWMCGKCQKVSSLCSSFAACIRRCSGSCASAALGNALTTIDSNDLKL